MKTVVLITTIVAHITPENGEGENLAVVIQETLQGVGVGTAALKHHLDIVLVFSEIWGVRLEVYHGTGGLERVIGISLRAFKFNSLV